MDRHHWIVSDPPHGEVDYEQGAALLGLTVADARLKINFRAPEPWLAISDAHQASDTAQALRDAGLQVMTVFGPNLLDVPSPTLATSFSFADDALVVPNEEGEVRVPYDAQVVGAFCRPPADFASGDRSARARDSFDPMRRRSERLAGVATPKQAAELLERRTNLDLYFSLDGGLRRLSFAEDFVDFSGLGEAMLPRAAANMDLTIAELEKRFLRLAIDKRMVNVRPRQRVTVGEPVHENRRLFSFGTIELQQLLASVSPEVEDITNYELASRISYLMLRGGDVP
jgi:hypothetical protein